MDLDTYTANHRHPMWACSYDRVGCPDVHGISPDDALGRLCGLLARTEGVYGRLKVRVHGPASIPAGYPTLPANSAWLSDVLICACGRVHTVSPLAIEEGG